MSMNFLNDFNKELNKMDGVGGSAQPPRFWVSMGNYVFNKIMSGSFYKGCPQGRVTALAGPSGTGKSLVAGNIAKNAQTEGVVSDDPNLTTGTKAHILVVDSENALDDDFMAKIGVDTENDYTYVSVTTISQVTEVVSKFMKGYRKEYGDAPDAPPVVVIIDSLDMLMTGSELDHYEKGNDVGDQGQRAKQLKAMLRTFVQDIKTLNATMVVTSQVYQASQAQILQGEGVWVVNQAVRYSLSQIALLTKLKLKGENKSVVEGIRMKVEGFKTRFTKPFQNVTVEIPYDTGIDPKSGLLDVALEMGIVEKNGSRYKIAGQDKSWYSKEFDQYVDQVLQMAESDQEAVLNTGSEAEIDDETESKEETKKRRQKKAGNEDES